MGDAVCILNESKQKFKGIGEIRKDPLGQYWTIGTTNFRQHARTARAM